MNVSRGIIGALCDKFYRDIKTHVAAIGNITHDTLLPAMLLQEALKVPALK